MLKIILFASLILLSSQSAFSTAPEDREIICDPHSDDKDSGFFGKIYCYYPKNPRKGWSYYYPSGDDQKKNRYINALEKSSHGDNGNNESGISSCNIESVNPHAKKGPPVLLSCSYYPDLGEKYIYKYLKPEKEVKNAFQQASRKLKNVNESIHYPDGKPEVFSSKLNPFGPISSKPSKFRKPKSSSR